mmetsp:Transcript_243/g.198  ORF Transcript_243/g.198 Transcript_243/m.198 type:complete len:110 (-) Transcript_243:63-392(-)
MRLAAFLSHRHAFVAPREVRLAAAAVALAPQAAKADDLAALAPPEPYQMPEFKFPNFLDPNFNFDEWLLTPEADYITVPTVIIGSIIFLYGVLWVFDRLTEGPNAPPTP